MLHMHLYCVAALFPYFGARTADMSMHVSFLIYLHNCPSSSELVMEFRVV